MNEKQGTGKARLKLRYSEKKYYFGVVAIMLAGGMAIGIAPYTKAEEQVRSSDSTLLNQPIVQNENPSVQPINTKTDTTVATVRAFMEAIQHARTGDVITIADTFSESLMETNVGSSVLTIDKDITIRSQNRTTLTLRGVNLETSAQVTLQNLNLSMIGSGQEAGSITISAGKLTLDDITTKISAAQSTIRPAILVRGGDVTIRNGTDETQFEKISDSGVAPARIELETANIRATQGVELSKATTVVTASNFISRFTGYGSVVFTGANIADVDLKDIASLSVTNQAVVTLQESEVGATHLESLVVESGATLNVRNRIFNIGEVRGRGLYQMQYNAQLGMTHLFDPIQIVIQKNDANYQGYEGHKYLEIQTSEVEPSLVFSVEPNGLVLKKVDHQWFLQKSEVVNRNNLELTFEDVGYDLTTGRYDIENSDYKNADTEYRSAFDVALQKAVDAYRNQAISQDELDAAEDALYESYEKLVEITTTEEEIPYRTIYKADDQSPHPAKTETVETEGRAGKIVITRQGGKVTKQEETLSKIDRVILVSTKPRELQEEIDFERIYENDASLESGKTVVVTPGKKGRKTSIIRYTVNSETGEVTEQTSVETSQAAVVERIKVGTKATNFTALSVLLAGESQYKKTDYHYFNATKTRQSAVTTAYQQARSLIKHKGATQVQVDQAIQRITDAKKQLDGKKTNTAALKKQIAAETKYKKTAHQYYNASRARQNSLLKAYSKARALLKKSTTTQAQVNQAIKDINDAQKKLNGKKTNFSTLKRTVTDTTRYIKKSNRYRYARKKLKQTYLSNYKKAKSLLLNKYASQTQVNQVIQVLKTGQKKLNGRSK